MTRHLILIALAVALGVPAAVAGEREGAMTGVLQLDMSSINSEMKALRDQVQKLTEELASLSKAATEMNTLVTTRLVPPEKWEYSVLRTTSEEQLNALGGEGWEAVAGFKDTLVLKRPLKEKK